MALRMYGFIPCFGGSGFKLAVLYCVFEGQFRLYCFLQASRGVGAPVGRLAG